MKREKFYLSTIALELMKNQSSVEWLLEEGLI
jgi:hypothetical protein